MIDKAAIVCTKPKQDARKSLTISLMDKQYRSYCHRARRCDVCKSSRLPNIFRSTHYEQAKFIPRSVSTISVNFFRYFEEPFRSRPHPRIKNKTSTNLNQKTGGGDEQRTSRKSKNIVKTSTFPTSVKSCKLRLTRTNVFIPCTFDLSGFDCIT